MQQRSKNKKAAFYELLFVLLPGFSSIFIFSPLANDEAMYKQVIVWFGYALMLVLIGVIVFKNNYPLSSLGIRIGNKHWYALIKTIGKSLLVFVFSILVFVLAGYFYGLLFGADAKIQTDGYNFIKGKLYLFLPMLVAVYFASSFGEEVIYRSFLIERLSLLFGNDKIARWISILLSAVFFGLVHFEWGPMGVVQTGFMGLALGLSYHWLKNNLWPNILAHAYLDTLLLIQLYSGN